MTSDRQYWFTSTRFEVETGEDQQTNPGIYGRQLANWLRGHLLQLGYPVEGVIAEDWGWCVMCQRDPYWLWIGCANLQDPESTQPSDLPPPKERLLWSAFTTAEIPSFKYLLRRRPDTKPGLEKLASELHQLLEADPSINIVDESATDAWFKEPPNGAVPRA